MGWYWWAAGALAALLLAVLIAANRCARMIVKAERRSFEKVRAKDELLFPGAFRAYDTMWPRTPFKLDVGDAVLSGEYILNPAGPNRVVVVCHGHSVNRAASVKYAALFFRMGWSVILYDQRYFGRSGGTRCTLGQTESEDLRKVAAFARDVFGRGCLLGFHGESMGASTVLSALRQETPDFVVADCPFADAEELMHYMLPHKSHIPAFPLVPLTRLIGRLFYGYDMRKSSPRADMAASEVPICLIHGLADAYIPCAHSEQIYALCRNPRSELHLVPGARHAGSYAADQTAYEAIVTAFVRNCTEEEKKDETD